MFDRKHRLAKTRDVHKVFALGRSFFNPLFTVKYLKAKDGSPRFTVVASTKVSKKAVIRNRLKRVIREFIRLNAKNFSAGDYVITVRPAAATLSAAVLRERLSGFLASSGLLLPPGR